MADPASLGEAVVVPFSFHLLILVSPTASNNGSRGLGEQLEAPVIAIQRHYRNSYKLKGLALNLHIKEDSVRRALNS